MQQTPGGGILAVHGLVIPQGGLASSVGSQTFHVKPVEATLLHFPVLGLCLRRGAPKNTYSEKGIETYCVRCVLCEG